MIHYLLRTKDFIPKEYHHSFFDIDFVSLYQQGYRLLLTDLDNTLISYAEEIATKRILEKIEELKNIGFEVVILSNNHQPRIDKFVKDLHISGYASAHKPLTSGIKKAVSGCSKQYKKSEIIIVGDQLMTDIWGANRYGSYAILVDPIKAKTEKWYTKLNRKIEENMINKIKRKESEIYKELSLDKR
ncbi:MAG: YqeG family HAD IIIA-type phosphatase [Bacilli bacterium]|nr:YqeG family HAD IIIA-type phosphatase [Bacilli bacterium]